MSVTSVTVSDNHSIDSPFSGLRVVELADEQAEYCGLLLAGLGAEVIKVEPPEGNSTRRIGPFYQGEKNDPEKSLFFWNYNRGKKSVALDLREESGRAGLLKLLETADVFLDSTPKSDRDAWGLSGENLLKRYPSLIAARISPFGDTGPWADYKGSDLVHLALGGVMMNCGYDYLPSKVYDQPPIAPQFWHAYHIAGEQMMLGITGALIYRFQTGGKGQCLSVAVHEAVSKNTETDVMLWVMRHAEVIRQTGRNATEHESPPSMMHTKDGRWICTNSGTMKSFHATTQLLDKYGMAGVLTEFSRGPAPEEKLKGGRAGTAGMGSMENVLNDLSQRFIRRFSFANVPWQEAQEMGILWAPLMKPHENLSAEHWQARGIFNKIEHPELGKSFDYVTGKWISSKTRWVKGRRAPRINEDAQDSFKRPVPAAPLIGDAQRRDTPEEFSRHGKPFPLKGVRIVDFSWFLASAGGTRFLTAMGAESIKIEYVTNPDTRFGVMAPAGGREAREKASGPIPGSDDPDMGGQFNNKNPGKRGLSLNVRHPKGLEIVRRLVAMSDVVAEGFSPGVLEKWGLGYEDLRKINPRIIVVKQSGMGTKGTYGRLRTVGPIAAAFSGLSELSGLPEPAMPVGWGYSYLDWIGAYSFALAILTSLYHRERTGEGQYIDASQAESGIFLSGTSILDWSANGAVTPRAGNRSPYKKAAPHGAYRCAGGDRWLAISCFTQEEWRALAAAAENENPGWAQDSRFASPESRLANQNALDAAIGSWTRGQNEYELMHKLQRAGVPAGVCQTAADRCERDPQLAHLNWLTEVTGTKIGRWPVYEMPVKFSETPVSMGGRIDRGAPCYGEDNQYVLGTLLGMSETEIAALASEGVI